MGERRGLVAFRLVFLVVVGAWCCAQAAIRILAVTNAASFVPGVPANGSLATIFSTGLTGITGVVGADRLPLPLQLAGVSVRVHGVPAPILAVAAADGYGQINIQVPWERGSGATPSIEVTQNGDSVRLETVESSGWGAFFSDRQGFGIVQHGADYSLVTLERPARRGEILIAYATGLGDVYPPVQTGHAAPLEPLSWVMSTFISASLGGQVTNTSFRGLAPGLVGVYQINFQVPDSACNGDLPLAFSVTTCPPFGTCGSPSFAQPVTTYGPSVKVPVR